MSEKFDDAYEMRKILHDPIFYRLGNQFTCTACLLEFEARNEEIAVVKHEAANKRQEELRKHQEAK